MMSYGLPVYWLLGITWALSAAGRRHFVLPVTCVVDPTALELNVIELSMRKAALFHVRHISTQFCSELWQGERGVIQVSL